MKVRGLSLANKKYDRKTPDQKQKELEEISAQALSQIEKYAHSPEDLLDYANFMAKFHNYSTNNTALIQQQFSGANAVASFKDWKDNGYSVNKGEKGIKILSYTPITFFKDKNGEQKTLYNASKEEKQLIKNNVLKSWKVPHFKLGHVFDVSQTNCPPEDLPKVFPNRQFNFTIEEGNNGKYLQKGIEAVAKELNINVRDMKDSELGLHELGAAKGVFAQAVDGRKEILLNSRNTDTQSLATAIHELAHARLHDKSQEESKFDSSTKEFQAELTSYIVCQHYGMDTTEKAIPYIAGWTQNGAKIEDKHKALEGVHRTSREFIEIMDNVISTEKEKDLQKNIESEVDVVNPRDQFKLELQELLNDDETMAYGEENEVIYKIDDITVYGGFDSGIRGVDHNVLISDDVSWEELIEWGTVVVPETQTYISDEIINEFEELGYNNLPVSSNQYVGYKNEAAVEEEKEVAENSGLYPLDPDEVRYCDLTGEPFANSEPYYYVDGVVYSEEAHGLIYTEEEWEDVYNSNSDDYYWTEEIYDLPDTELTEVKPKNLYNDVYYKYNPNDQTKPEKLGTMSDIVSKAYEQSEFDRFSYNRELVIDLYDNRGEEKEEFNQAMEHHHVLKNPTLQDFQRVNEKEGLDKNDNLEEMVQDNIEQRRQIALQRAMQR